MNGEDGDDLLIWNNGDGSDRMEGGAGTDVAQDNGAPAGDQFVVTANNGRVSAVRTNLGLFFLDIGTSETLDINGLAGDDRVDVGPGLGALIKVDYEGGDGTGSIRARNDSSRPSTAAAASSARVDKTRRHGRGEGLGALLQSPEDQARRLAAQLKRNCCLQGELPEGLRPCCTGA